MNPKKFFYVVMGVIVVTLGLGGYGYVYALGRLHSAQSNFAQAMGQQAADQTTIDKLTHMKAQYAKEVKPALPLMDAALPRAKNQTQLLSQLRTVASNRGLALGTVTFSGSAGKPSDVSQTVISGSVLALPVSFDVQGSFDKLQAFLTDLESLNRLNSVTALNVSRPDRSKPIVYSITLNAYVKP
jgi:Tfp pilus assembly protein PilO